MPPERQPSVRDLYPDFNEDQLKQAEEFFERYIALSLVNEVRTALTKLPGGERLSINKHRSAIPLSRRVIQLVQESPPLSRLPHDSRRVARQAALDQALSSRTRRHFHNRSVIL